MAVGQVLGAIVGQDVHRPEGAARRGFEAIEQAGGPEGEDAVAGDRRRGTGSESGRGLERLPIGMAPDLLARGDPIADHALIVAPLLLGEGVIADDGQRPPAGADALAPQGPRRAGLPIAVQASPGNHGLPLGPEELRIVVRRFDDANWPALPGVGRHGRAIMRGRMPVADGPSPGEVHPAVAGQPVGLEQQARGHRQRQKRGQHGRTQPHRPRPREHPSRPAQGQTARHEDQRHVSPGKERAGQRRGDHAVGDKPTQEGCRVNRVRREKSAACQSRGTLARRASEGRESRNYGARFPRFRFGLVFHPPFPVSRGGSGWPRPQRPEELRRRIAHRPVRRAIGPSIGVPRRRVKPLATAARRRPA